MTRPLNYPRANVFVSIVAEMAKPGRRGALRLLSLSKISILILKENKNAEMLGSSLFFYNK